MTDLILFDVDGTLIDSGAIIIGAQIRTAEELGLVFPGREAGFAVVGRTLDDALVDLFGNKAPVDMMVSTYSRIFRSLRGTPGFEENMFEGVPAMLAQLAQRPNTRLGIATGKRAHGVEHIITLHHWEGLFATVQNADTAPSKPHPGMILNGMAAIGAEPQRTVMIGDSVHDMAMARAAGVTPIAVDWGFQPSSLLVEAGAAVVAHQVADLPRLIGKILGPHS